MMDAQALGKPGAAGSWEGQDRSSPGVSGGSKTLGSLVVSFWSCEKMGFCHCMLPSVWGYVRCPKDSLGPCPAGAVISEGETRVQRTGPAAPSAADAPPSQASGGGRAGAKPSLSTPGLPGTLRTH